MSLPSMTMSAPVPSSRWRSTSSRRTPGSAETTDAAAPISSERMRPLTSLPPAHRRPSSSNRSRAAAATGSTAASSARSTPASVASSPTARYIAPVSR